MFVFVVFNLSDVGKHVRVSCSLHAVLHCLLFIVLIIFNICNDGNEKTFI